MLKAIGSFICCEGNNFNKVAPQPPNRKENLKMQAAGEERFNQLNKILKLHNLTLDNLFKSAENSFKNAGNSFEKMRIFIDGTYKKWGEELPPEKLLSTLVIAATAYAMKTHSSDPALKFQRLILDYINMQDESVRTNIKKELHQWRTQEADATYKLEGGIKPNSPKELCRLEKFIRLPPDINDFGQMAQAGSDCLNQYIEFMKLENEDEIPKIKDPMASMRHFTQRLSRQWGGLSQKTTLTILVLGATAHAKMDSFEPSAVFQKNLLAYIDSAHIDPPDLAASIKKQLRENQPNWLINDIKQYADGSLPPLNALNSSIVEAPQKKEINL